MQLIKTRTHKTENSAIGDFFVDGVKLCFGLEPTDRGLTSDMTLEEIQKIKIPDKTAVPTGTYRVISYLSPTHGKKVPRVIDVPGSDFIEIHIGNFPKDTKGCLVLGMEMGVDVVLQSEAAIDEFYGRFFEAIDRNEEVWITYQQDEPIADTIAAD